ncbi:MAG: T9SS type A sorting domain-containing protein [Bacteroidota bacterium]
MGIKVAYSMKFNLNDDPFNTLDVSVIPFFRYYLVKNVFSEGGFGYGFSNTYSSNVGIDKSYGIRLYCGIGSNPQNGSCQIVYTIDHTCGISDQIESKSFWVGKPAHPSTNPSGYPTVQMTLNEMMPISATSGGASSFIWNATGSITKVSSHGSVMTVEATYLGNGNFYCNGVNTCGTSSTGGGAVYVSYGGGQLGPLLIYPNPSSDYLSLEVDESLMESSKTSIDEQLKDLGTNAYLRILDQYGDVKLVEKYSGERYLQLNISVLDKGIYTLQLISESEVFSSTIIVN